MKDSHGGNIYLLAEGLGVADSDIVDFSASINPLGVPQSVQSAIRENMRFLFNYPDPDTKRLRLKISEHIGASADSIICGNGSTELIYLIARALRPARVLIPGPTFSEYETACRKSGHEIKVESYRLKPEDSFDLKPDEFISEMGGALNLAAGTRQPARPFEMVYICNPNNPTGRLIKREEMLRIASAAKDLKCILVVDEAFIDFCPGATIAEEVADNPYLIVLRSLTKIYALSGLRIGYAVLHPSLLQAVKEAKEPWSVNTLAQIAGVVALDDGPYRAETYRVVAEQKKYLEEGFRRLGISFIPSPVNYYLLNYKGAQELMPALRKKGILVRDCSNFPGLDGGQHMRVAVKSERDNARLLKEISLCMA
jgi:threonine-phosphate decarboxylase